MLHRNLFFFILAACFVCIDPQSGLSLHSVTTPVLTAFLLSCLTCLFPNRLQGILGLLLCEAVISICVIDCYCQVYFGSSITPQMLTNILLSDARETGEFLTAFVSGYAFRQWRIVVLLLLAVLFPACLFCKRPLIIGKTWKIAGVAVLVICTICEIPAIYRYAQLFRQQQNPKNVEGLIFRHDHEALPTPLHRLAFAYYVSNLSADILDGIKRSTFEAKVDSCSYLSPHMVLIIGESYNKHHASLYGYYLPTTPLQQQRAAGGELFPYTDVVTPWNITSNVFLDVFSLWEHGQKMPITDYPLFPILFRRAGYSVRFFSNQYLLRGFRKGATNQAGHFFLADKALSDTLFSYRNHKATKYDMELVKQVSKYKSKEHASLPYTLDIIHLIGQHFDYAMRYPHGESAFSMAAYDDRNIDEKAKQAVMHYDNAIRYNDTVLDSLLMLYEHEESIVIFVADHGEEVYDELPVHGRLFQTPTAAQARQEFEVPLWIWCSESYREHHQDIVSAISSSVQKALLTDGLPQMLLSLAGISCRWYEPRRNILNADYESKARVIAGESDYDKLTK